MADRVVAMMQGEEGMSYLWDSGWLVTFNPHTKEWTKQEVRHPHKIGVASPNREAAPEVACDD